MPKIMLVSGRYVSVMLAEISPLNPRYHPNESKGPCWDLYYSFCTSTIYVDHLINYRFYLFADDTNLLYADRDINPLERVVNAELSKVQEWLVANKLTLNAKKSNFVIFILIRRNLIVTSSSRYLILTLTSVSSSIKRHT